MNKAIIFDMDGVIIDSEIMFLNSVNRYLHSIGILENISKEFFQSLIGREDYEISRLIKEEYKLNQTVQMIYEGMNYYYDLEMNSVGVFSEIKGLSEFLEKVHNDGYHLAIASSSPYKWIYKVIDDLKIREYFKVICSGEEVTKSKPDPEIYNQASKKLNIKAENCYVIEDSYNGILSAKNANMFVYGFKMSEVIQDTSLANVEVYSFSEIYENLKSPL